VRPVAQGKPVSWQDVEIDVASEAVKLRRDMEAAFAA
jgi:predicted homoserine dehydrogenase-like protein